MNGGPRWGQFSITKKSKQAFLEGFTHGRKWRHSALSFGNDVTDLIYAEPGNGVVYLRSAIPLQVRPMADLTGLLIDSTASSSGHSLWATAGSISSASRPRTGRD